MPDNTLTMRQIAEGWAVSNPTARKRLESTEPVRKAGNSKHYALRDVVLAMEASPDDVNREEMQPRDRKDLADAELKEMKVKRMDAEEVDAIEVGTLIVSILKRLADSIKACESMTPKEKRGVCKQLRDDAARVIDDVESCKFAEAE